MKSPGNKDLRSPHFSQKKGEKNLGVRWGTSLAVNVESEGLKSRKGEDGGERGGGGGGGF